MLHLEIHVLYLEFNPPVKSKKLNLVINSRLGPILVKQLKEINQSINQPKIIRTLLLFKPSINLLFIHSSKHSVVESMNQNNPQSLIFRTSQLRPRRLWTRNNK